MQSLLIFVIISFMQTFVITTFKDIIDALMENPQWREEMRRLVLTEELLSLPSRFDNFVENEFKPLKKDVEVLKQDVEVLKQDVEVLKQDVEILKKDVEILKQDVEILKKDVEVLKRDVGVLKNDVGGLKGESFERKVREKAPAFFGNLLRRVKTISIEQYAEMLDEANERGIISDEERFDALNIDVVVKGRMKDSGKEIMLAAEVSITVDVTDVDRASRRAKVFTKAYGLETIGVVIGQQINPDVRGLADECAVLVL